MKLKALVAVMALASGVAHAGYASFTDATQAGSLSLAMYNASSSAFFDLGLTSAQFTAPAFGGLSAAQIAAAPATQSLQVTWDFNTGAVTSTGAFNVSGLLAGVSGDWSAAWNAYQPNVASSTFSIFAGDRDGPATTAQHYLSTAANSVATTRNSNLANFNTIGQWADNQQLTGGGNHAAVANGANVITDNTSVLYQGAVGGMQSNWNGKASFTSVAPTSNALDFYALDGVTGSSAAFAAVTNYNGKFAVDAAAGTLTWTTTVAAVPEASTYAMLLAGLGLMGLMVRRRTL